jgi:hypothetical protein
MRGDQVVVHVVRVRGGEADAGEGVDLGEPPDQAGEAPVLAVVAPW